MANETRKILIESIFGGEAAYTSFADADQFLASFSIDPDVAVAGTFGTSGIIAPVISGAVASVSAKINWIVPTPKGQEIYLYGSNGSVYTYTIGTGVTGIGDLNDGGSSSGNGAAYYDNYVYFARDTTVARYGPLNGTPAWTDDYWVGTLGKAALSNETYPENGDDEVLPNHVMQRHKDGSLYFADVVGNQGVLHKIKTRKSTVEGDTDDGSTYTALDFGYGFWPTALESLGESLVVSLFEGSVSSATNPVRAMRAKIAIWDTTNQFTFDQISGEEFPDSIISALLNSNGILYVFSGEQNQIGTHVTRFTGGFTQEEVGLLDRSPMPLASAVDGFMNKIFFGGQFMFETNAATVYAVGVKKSQISKSIFSVMGEPTLATTKAQALKLVKSAGNMLSPLVAIYNSSTGITSLTTAASGEDDFELGSYAVYISSPFRIGQRFKVTKIAFALSQFGEIPDGASIRVDLAMNGFTDVRTVHTITNLNVPSDGRVVLKPDGVTGHNDFSLFIQWHSTISTPIYLPIEIEYETIDD